MSKQVLSEGQDASRFPIPKTSLGSESSKLENPQHVNSSEEGTAFTGNSVRNFPPAEGV